VLVTIEYEQGLFNNVEFSIKSTDIFSEIIELGNGNEVRIANISHKSGLPYNLLKKYLKILLQNNLLEYHGKEKTYKTTSKGIYFLGLYHNLLNIVLLDIIDKAI
jgi:predicted transcriptional regulator